MPFTLSHPAIIFPLLKKKRYFSATALIVGSMVPDIEFMAIMQESDTCSHHFPGVLLINIPIGILCCFIFHAFIKQRFIPNLPIGLRTRFVSLLESDWITYALRNKLTVIISLSLGISSHLLWDAFTHETGFAVSLFPFLKDSVTILNRTMPLYHLLQIVSSVIGLLALLHLVYRLPKNHFKDTTLDSYYWIELLLLIIGLSVVRFYLLDINNGFWDVVIALMGIGMYSLILSSLTPFLWPRKQVKLEP